MFYIDNSKNDIKNYSRLITALYILFVEVIVTFMIFKLIFAN